MPILTRFSGRVLPANQRAVDVARQEIQRLIPAHAQRTHNAMAVGGYESIIYLRKTSGIHCACKRKSKEVHSRLDTEGNLSPGLIESLISGDQSGPAAYGTKYRDRDTYFDVDQAVEDLVDPFDRLGKSTPPDLNRMTTDSQDPNSGTLLDDDGLEELITGPVLDYGGTGLTDNSCPICFGTGFVGGYDPLSGYRSVLSYQHPNCISTGTIDLNAYVPTIVCDSITFEVLLPPAIAVDAFQAYSGRTKLTPRILVDSTVIISPKDLIGFCDGKVHTLELEWDTIVDFTHMELQLQTSESIPVDFPKVTRQSLQTVIDNYGDMSIQVTPFVPLLRPGDIVSESTLGRNFMVKNVSPHLDIRAHALGWEADIRVIQPQELTWLLPRRNKTTSTEYRTVPPILPNKTSP